MRVGRWLRGSVSFAIIGALLAPFCDVSVTGRRRPRHVISTAISRSRCSAEKAGSCDGAVVSHGVTGTSDVVSDDGAFTTGRRGFGARGCLVRDGSVTVWLHAVTRGWHEHCLGGARLGTAVFCRSNGVSRRSCVPASFCLPTPICAQRHFAPSS